MKCAVADVGLVCQAFPVSPSMVPNFLIAVANYPAESIQGNRAFWFMVQEYSPSWWLEWLWLEPWMHVAAAYYNDICQQAQRAQQEVGPPITLKSCPLGYLLPAAKPLRAPLPPQTATTIGGLCSNAGACGDAPSSNAFARWEEPCRCLWPRSCEEKCLMTH